MADYVLAGLLKRRSELAGEIEQARETFRKLIVDMEHLDATIGQFDPQYEPESIRPRAFFPQKDWAKRGEMTQIVLDVLREGVGPMTTHEIAYEMIALRGMDREDKRLVRRITKRVGVALRDQEIKGVTRTEPKVGRFQAWSLS